LKEKIYKKEIPTDPELMPEVDDYIMDIAREYKVEESKFNGLSLSVAEALANSIFHGNKTDPGKIVTITVSITETEFSVSFRDQGAGFDPDSVPDPTTPENIMKDHGRGIHIMKTYMDRVQFVFHDNGTELIIAVDR